MTIHQHLPVGFYLFCTGAVIVIASLTLFAGFRPIDRLVDRWATAHGLELDGEARVLVAQRLRAGRRIRTIGFVVGYSVPVVWALVGQDPVSALPALFPVHWWNLAGYFAGALIAELSFARRSSPVGVAVLARRALADYLSPAARVVPRLVAAAGVAAAMVYLLVPSRHLQETRGEQLVRRLLTESATQMWITAAFVVGVVVLVEVVQRSVLRRRQQFASESLVRADDSLRAWSLRILAWISTTVAFSALAWTLIPLGFKSGLVSAGDGSFALALVFAGYGPLLVALVSFRWLSRPLARWQVRRVSTQPA